MESEEVLGPQFSVHWPTCSPIPGKRFPITYHLHVYDGYNRIYALDGLTLSGGSCKNSWHVIDMGSYKPINSALGLSIAVDAGVERISHQVQIFAVAAEWQGSSQL